MKHFDYYLSGVDTPQLKPEAYRVILEIMNEIEDWVWDFNRIIALEGLENGGGDKVPTTTEKRA